MDNNQVSDEVAPLKKNSPKHLQTGERVVYGKDKKGNKVSTVLVRLIPQTNPTKPNVIIGFSCCNPDDNFSRGEGIKYARKRAGKYHKQCERLLKIPLKSHTKEALKILVNNMSKYYKNVQIRLPKWVERSLVENE